mmetsp:Transcript_90663/g.170930  ORF Transcript_90663/g.170930 Transcript_90663/m.170930 type:complete len:719 (-) Transcript_90663:75-2231(-)
MTCCSKNSRKAHSSRMVWRERAANASPCAVAQEDKKVAKKEAPPKKEPAAKKEVDMKSSKKFPYADRPVSSSKVAENVRQGSKRSFKSILLSSVDGAVTGQRGQVPCWQNSKSGDSRDLFLTGSDQAMARRGKRSESPVDASRTWWADLSDEMSEDGSDSAGAWESSTTEVGKCGASSTDADVISVPESTQTTGMDSSTTNSNKEGGSDSWPTDNEAMLFLPSSSLDDSQEEALPENVGSEFPATPNFELQHCGIRTPEPLEEQELMLNDHNGDLVELEMGEASCYWLPTWTPSLVAAADVAEDLQQEALCPTDGSVTTSCLNSEQSGDGTNVGSSDISPTATSPKWEITGWMPVVTMIDYEACPQQSDQGICLEEKQPQPMADCFLSFDGMLPVSEDAMQERLIQWKIDSAWSEEGQEASSSEAQWQQSVAGELGEFEAAFGGDFDIAFGEFDASEWFPGDVDAWSQDLEVDWYSTCHYVQAAKALANARAMAASMTVFDDTWTTTGDKSLDDGTVSTAATTSSGVDAGSWSDSLDGSLPGFRSPVHGNVPRTRNFAAESRTEDKQEVTTLMIRNIPNRYKRSTLMRELDRLGLTGKYDFLYIPVDRGTSWNVGYAFVNFITPEYASECMEKLADHVFSQCKEGMMRKVAQVSPAHMQGYERNVQYYRGCAVYSARECQRPLIAGDISAPHGRSSTEARPAPAAVEDALSQRIKQFL